MEKLEELDLSEDELNWMLRVTAGFSQFELSLADLLYVPYTPKITATDLTR